MRTIFTVREWVVTRKHRLNRSIYSIEQVTQSLDLCIVVILKEKN